jgi:hypothetical protein
VQQCYLQAGSADRSQAVCACGHGMQHAGWQPLLSTVRAVPLAVIWHRPCNGPCQSTWCYRNKLPAKVLLVLQVKPSKTYHAILNDSCIALAALAQTKAAAIKLQAHCLCAAQHRAGQHRAHHMCQASW